MKQRSGWLDLCW